MAFDADRSRCSRECLSVVRLDRSPTASPGSRTGDPLRRRPSLVAAARDNVASVRANALGRIFWRKVPLQERFYAFEQSHPGLGPDEHVALIGELQEFAVDAAPTQGRDELLGLYLGNAPVLTTMCDEDRRGDLVDC